MYKLLCCLVCLFLCASAHAVKWPAVSDLRITRCQGGTPAVAYCSQNVYYRASGVTTMVEAPDRSDPGPADTEKVTLFGIHCSNKVTQFSGCYWDSDLDHRPSTFGSCLTTSKSSWEITSSSKCGYSSNEFGSHSGATPGGECLVFGKASNRMPPTISTPWGELSAETVANSGSTYCIKPLAPNATCEISIPGDGVIYHSNITPSQQDVRYLYGDLNCGDKPKMTIVGGGNLTLGKGVTVSLSADVYKATQLILRSTLNTNNAEPGEYRAAVVIVASPN